MSGRTEKMESLLDELALVVDGDRDAIARHADFLADDDEARDLKHDAAEIAEQVSRAGADYVPPADLEARLMAALDRAGDASAPDGGDAGAGDAGRATAPGFVIDPQELASARASVQTSGEHPAGTEAALGATRVADRVVAPTAAMPQIEAPAAREGAQGAGHGTQSSPRDDRGARTGKVIALFGALGFAAAAVAAIGILVPALLDDDELAHNGNTHDTTGAVAAGATTGRLAHIARASSDGATGVEVRPAGGSWASLAAEGTIPAGGSVRTDERTRARIALSDGSEMVLNHSTEVRFDPSSARRFEIPSGEVLADIAHLEQGPNASFTVPTGRVEVLGTKFVLAATTEMASVRVTRGSVRMQGRSGAASEVKPGEEGVVRASGAPEVSPVMDLARSFAWAELENDVVHGEEPQAVAGIGSLRARRPGEREDHERPLHLARHEVRVRIVGNVARTEIEEVFRNDSDQTLEGIYRFPLPSDAQIARLALDVDGDMVEGAFVARERAQRIWRGVIRNATPIAERRPTEEFIWVPGPWRDPALLEWQRGGQFELRIFPIPAHGERRVVLAYSQLIAPQTEGRRYVYPLAHSSDDSTRVGEMTFDVRIAGARSVRPSGYPTTSATEEDATRLRYTQTDFRPNGDLVIDYQLPEGERELSYWTYQGTAAQSPPERSRDQDREVIDLQRQIAADARGYVAFALRPRLPARTEGRTRDYVIVVDSSQSMVGERWQRATRLALGMITELDRRDRFTVLACDYQCRSIEGTAEGARMRTPSAGELRTVSEWLGRIEPAGASDLLATMRSAASAAGAASGRQQHSVHVVYVGDGIASVGHRRAGTLAAEAGRIAQSAHVAFTTVGIGADADSQVLAEIARNGGGHYVPFVPGQRTSLAALSVLETTYGVALRDAVIQMPEGLTEIAPSALPTIRAGEELIVTARMARSEVDGEVVLRGTVGGEPFEQRYPVALRPSTSAGNLFVPALWASHRIEQLELEGQGSNEARVVALSKAYSVMSRSTSLLVLESEAMFRAFGIDRTEQPIATWTGEEELDGIAVGGTLAAEPADEASGSYALTDDAAPAEAGGSSGGRRARSGGGSGSGAGFAGAGDLQGHDSLATAESSARRRASTPQAQAIPRQAEAAEEERPQTRADFDRAWSEPRREQQARPSPPVAATTPVIAPPPRGPGQWMRRVYYRVGSIAGDGSPSFREQEQARLTEEALRMQPDSRDRHRAAVRALARAGSLERALEVAEAWFARDRQDPDSLVARADVLARLGRRDEALRLLTGTVDVRADDAALHERLAAAFDRIGDAARACAHRVSIAEIRGSDADAIGAAMRCERALGHRELASLVLAAVREDAVRTRANRAAEQTPTVSTPRGELMVEATWAGGDSVDVALIAPDGSRLSWMGGRTTIVGRDAAAAGHEQLGLRTASVGQYLVEVTRTDPNDHGRVSGQLRIRALDETRSVPFVIDEEERASVARVVVRRESRMEAVQGAW
jgi:tetratricopeptide (TPR) repeat protein